MLLDDKKQIKAKWRKDNKDWYIGKGYVFTKLGDEFEIPIYDLKDTSSFKVNIKCDNPDCKNPYLKPQPWHAYKRYVHEDGKYYCNECSHKLFSSEKIIKGKFKNSKSLGYWLMKNLHLKEAVKIINRWDEEKNGCDIREVSYGSNGINKKGYWFECSRGIHPSELKNTHAFINNFNKNGFSNSFDCDMCNSIAQYGYDNIDRDFLSKYWDWEKNEELGIDPWKINKSSDVKFWIKCKEKSYHGSYFIRSADFVKGYRCPYCSHKSNKLHRFDSLGWLCPQVFDIWSNKNKKSPYEYTYGSNEKVWWECKDNRHKDYKRNINESRDASFRCPKCAKEDNKANWKGGITPLHMHLRGKALLQWKKDSMKNCNYKCVITGNKFNAIHHLYGFDLILQEIIKITKLPIYEKINKYTKEELRLLDDTCIELHSKYGLGVCLSNEIHKLFHKYYGKGGNTPEQFEEFKQRYKNGEFNKF